MGNWSRLFSLLACVVPLLARASTVAGQFCADIGSGNYDCSFGLDSTAGSSAKAAVRLQLEWDAGKPGTQVTLTREAMVVETMDGRKRTVAGRFPLSLPVGKSCRFIIMRRGSRLGIMRDGVPSGSCNASRGAGIQAAITADRGWTVSEPQIQRIEPVVFADDFMRDPGASGPWTKVSGAWAQKSVCENIVYSLTRMAYIQQISTDPNTNEGMNPFAWAGKSAAGKPATCTAGNSFWEDYSCSVAVNPVEAGACGLLANLTEAGTGLLVRWTPANSRKPDGNRLTLSTIDLKEGRTTELASDPGGYIPGEWCTLTVVSSLEGVRVLVDGRERINKPQLMPWRGAIGLYAEGAEETVFDDVAVYGRTVDFALLAEARLQTITRKFLIDPKGMKEWSIQLNEWVPDAADAGFRWYRTETFGTRNWMTMTFKPAAKTSGELWMTLDGDGASTTSGYRAMVALTGSPPLPTYALYRNEKELATTQTAPLAADAEYDLRFRRLDNRLTLEIDGETVLSATDARPLSGTRAGYRTAGDAFTALSNIQLLSDHSWDVPFTEAPVDWQPQGTWEQSNRWSCTPDWSFLSGWSRGDAVLWQKHRFTGDHSLEAYVSSKMDYPRETDVYYNRQGHFAISLCSDGRDPRNGYAGIYGYPDEQGNPLGRAVLIRNGVIVASVPIARRAWSTNHHSWYYLQLNKRGNTVSFLARVDNEVYPLTFTDPNPIPGGIPAIWTYDSAMCVSRVRLNFSNPPQVRTDPRVIIADPWYPEWANRGMTLALDLSASWSTTGRPVTVKAVPAAIPAGDEDAVAVAGSRATFTAKMPGSHWYQLTAVDGTTVSEPFHLSLPVFDPALKRDDSHALVLYRFDEGQGTVAHDCSPVAPALDLTVTPNPACCQWLPGQGLKVRGGCKPIRSALAADKLLALAKTNACTFECWASSDTLYGTPGYSGTFLSWETDQPGVQAPVPCLGFGNYANVFAIAPGGVPFQPSVTNFGAPGFLTSLHHTVITWDGNMTSFYFDGMKIAELPTPWKPASWVAGAHLFVGSQQDAGRPFPGAFYLLGIHDRCLTADEVMRHYRAGPSAR